MLVTPSGEVVIDIHYLENRFDGRSGWQDTFEASYEKSKIDLEKLMFDPMYGFLDDKCAGTDCPDERW